jgi:hypothetical protein
MLDGRLSDLDLTQKRFRVGLLGLGAVIRSQAAMMTALG